MDVTGATFDFSQLGACAGPTYTFLTYGGMLTGTPTIANVPSGYAAQIGGGVGSLTPVPEPSTLALLACGLMGLVAYAWRKRK